MKPDKRMLNRLLAMNDQQLTDLICTIADEAGIDPTLLGLNPDHIQSLRNTLESADEQMLEQMGEVIETYRQNTYKRP